MTNTQSDRGPKSNSNIARLTVLWGIYGGYRLVAAAVVAVVLGGVAYNYQSGIWAQWAATQAGPKQAVPKGNGINLIWPSENFSDARWQLDKAKVQPSSTTPLGGTGKAERLVEAEGLGMHRILAGVSGLTPGAVHTFSVFVKPAQRGAIMLEARDEQPIKSYGRAGFDLNKKAVIFRTEEIIDAGIVPIADGWYRCWISLAYTGKRAVVDIGLVNGEGNHSYQGDGRSGIDLWGAQFELGSLDLYAPTLTGPSSVPTTASGASAGASSAPSSAALARVDTAQTLREGTGLNLLWPSENFSDARWQLDKVTVETSLAIPLGGTGKADRLIEADVRGIHRIEAVVSGLTPGAVHTFSIFARPEQRSAIMLEARDDPMVKYGRVSFDLIKKAVLFRTGDIIDAGIEPVAGGWYRCWISIAYTGERAVVDIGLVNEDGGHYYQGDGRSGIVLWGAQLERGGGPGKYAQTVDGPSGNSQ